MTEIEKIARVVLEKIKAENFVYSDCLTVMDGDDEYKIAYFERKNTSKCKHVIVDLKNKVAFLTGTNFGPETYLETYITFGDLEKFYIEYPNLEKKFHFWE